MSSNFKIFCVSFEDEYKECIVAEKPEQALDYYNERADDEFKVTIEAVSEIPFETISYFETEGGYQKMSFAEFLNYDGPFEYKGPTLICWTE